MKLLVAALLILAFTPAPLRQSYDKKRDVTTYASGDIHTGGLTGMAAEFEFPGKQPTRPATVHMGFGHLRVPNDQDDLAADASLLHWQAVTQITLDFAGTQLELPTKEKWQVSRNSMVLTFYGHAVEESVGIDLTTDQFTSLAGSQEFKVTIGKDVKTIRGKALGPLRKLAESIPRA